MMAHAEEHCAVMRPESDVHGSGGALGGVMSMWERILLDDRAQETSWSGTGVSAFSGF